MTSPPPGRVSGPRRPKRSRSGDWRRRQLSRNRSAALALRHARRSGGGGGNSSDNSGPLILLLVVVVPIVLFTFAAMNGYEGREHTVGIDLGTTNSVICVRVSRGFVNPLTKWWFGERSMRNNKGMGSIECIPDTINGARLGHSKTSVIVPSVVTVLNSTESGHSHVLHRKIHKRTYWEEIVPRPFDKSWWIDLLPMPVMVKEWMFPPAVVYAPLEVPFNVSGDDVQMRESTLDVHVGAYATHVLRHDHPEHTVYQAKRYMGQIYEEPANVHEESAQKCEKNTGSSADAPPACHAQIDSQVDSHDGKVGYQIVPAPGDTDGDHTTYAFRLPLSPSVHTTLSPTDVGSLVLSHLRRMAELYLKHAAATSVVVTVPAKFDRRARDATLDAYARAGYHVARVLEEPVAAAIAYGLQETVVKQDETKHILVYDFGGGTLDVCILYISYGGYVEVMAVDGDVSLGGADFDEVLADWFMERIGADVGRTVAGLERVAGARGWTTSEVAEGIVEEGLCADIFRRVLGPDDDVTLCHPSSVRTMGESLKMALSYADTATTSCLAVEETAVAFDSVRDFCRALRPMPSMLTREEFDTLVSHLVERAGVPIYRLLEETGLTTDDINEVVMVGGTTRMPAIRELVRTILGVHRLNIEIDPDLTIAYGAASVVD